MARSGIYYSISFLLFTLLFAGSSVARENNATGFGAAVKDSLILSGQLYNTDNDIVTFKVVPQKSIFLLLTEKSCMPCYAKLEKYFAKHYPGYSVNIVAVTSGNPLEIRDKVSLVSSYYGSYSNLYFIHYDRSEENLPIIARLAQLPSPYFFLFDEKGAYRYSDTEATTKLIY